MFTSSYTFPLLTRVGRSTAQIIFNIPLKKPELISLSLFQAAGNILTLIFDGMIFIFTVSRTWVISHQAEEAGIQASLSSLLLRDGEFSHLCI